MVYGLQIEIRAEKALALDFVFDKFWLPKGGKFFIFNPVTNETIGAITSQYLSGEKSKPNRFSTAIVKGNTIILEYYQPAGEDDIPVINVEKAYYTYIPVLIPGYSCSYEVNVNCSEGSNWKSEKNAVALVYCRFAQDGKWGSGSLVNNVLNNRTPYFLTADHCLLLDYTQHSGYYEKKDAISDNDLSDWVFYWGYERDSCDGTIPPVINRTTIGATVIANNSYSDFALLQLHQDPQDLSDYVPYYLGWDASGSPGTGGVCIHHPQHDVKKISTYSCTPFTDTFNSSPAVYWGVHWSQTANGYGITEEGSSGSPLINSSHKVIGQLTGGYVQCTNLTDVSDYGKLSVSWTGNGNDTIQRRLDYWLDPTGTNTQVMNGCSPLDSVCISGSNTICDIALCYLEFLPTGYGVAWSIDNQDFSITPIGSQCYVDYIGLFPMNSVANLTATISRSGMTVKTLTKRIVMHGTDLLVYGEQDSYVSSNGIFPDRFFTIPANNGLATIPERINKEDFVDKESLPIVFVEDNSLIKGPPSGDLCGYGITDINGGNMVYLNSTRFDGMDISFSGSNSPTYFSHSGNYVLFMVPYEATEYPLTLYAHSSDLCHDFCLTFNVVPLPGAASGDDDIYVNLDGSMLYITFFGTGTYVGNGQYYLPPYNVTITRIPSGTQVYSDTFPGTQSSFSVNTSSWGSGIYSIRITQGSNVYTKSIYL